MKEIFYKCKSLTELPNISKWDVSKVTNITGMFHDCEKLYKIPDISIWNTINLKEYNNIFDGCSLLSSFPDLSKWNIDDYKFSLSVEKNISSLSINENSFKSVNSSLSKNLSNNDDNEILKINNVINYNDIATTLEDDNNDINYEYYQNFYN